MNFVWFDVKFES